ncbi:MAG: tRNA 2-thiouridine(34) synthase MnmA [Pseudomonadota bacterium]
MNDLLQQERVGKRVIVGMSGGVDSSVTAWLLKQQGMVVEALHMTNWEADDEYCSAAEDLQDARRVCEQLDIPLHHVNFASDYRQRVFDYFLDEYRRGRTPNPDVLCNREIKFGVFAQYAKRLGADFLATGHYARTTLSAEKTLLLKGVDPNKDQTYFLHAVPGTAFANTLFPLGELAKPRVRELATEAGLATHRKKDSTGICFIGERPFREFLSRYLPAQPGDILDTDGQLVGTHSGLMYYTLGQRQGLGIGGQKHAADAPWFVARKDLPSNTLIVTQDKQHPDLHHDRLRCDAPHWINGAAPVGARLTAKIRHRQPDQWCRVDYDANGALIVAFETLQWAVACGQYVVLYDGDTCLGGGAIDAVWHATGSASAQSASG